MNGTTIIVGAILPYVAVTSFVGGVAYRLGAWRRAPQPGKATLYPTGGWGLLAALKELVLFPQLFRGDRTLWLVAGAFHAGLLLAFVGHFRAVTSLVDAALAGVGLGPAGIERLSSLLGGAAGMVLLASALGLLLRRLLVPRVREISGGPDYAALALLIAAIASGNLLRFGGAHVDLAETRAWVLSLLSFTPVVPRDPAFLLHAFFAELVVLYVAYSKLLHFGGLFFSLPLLRRT